MSERAREPSMGQVRKFFEMIGQEKMSQELFQLFIEDPWRVLDAVWFPSDRSCDMPYLGGALTVNCLKLGEHLREEDIPWKPEEPDKQGGKFAYLRVERVEGQHPVRELRERLAARGLLPGTLSDLLRLARWNEAFYWEIPVVALGEPITREDMGRSRTYFPMLAGRTLYVIPGEDSGVGDRSRIFYLGRVKM